MQNLSKIRQIIKESTAILINAGAGMSVESGLPDFRGKNGFWNAYPQLGNLGFSFEKIATPQSFLDIPELAWGFYLHRHALYAKSSPHQGYQILLEFLKSKQDNYFVMTSNVDGHFFKAGFQRIYECHGNINFLQCSCSDEIWKLEKIIPVDPKTLKPDSIPKCPKCGKIARPNILMFEDYFDFNSLRYEAQFEDYQFWLRSQKREKLVILEIGAGTAIPTIRNAGEKIAIKYPNATLLRINPNDFSVTEGLGYGVPYGALEGLKKILS